MSWSTKSVALLNIMNLQMTNGFYCFITSVSNLLSVKESIELPVSLSIVINGRMMFHTIIEIISLHGWFGNDVCPTLRWCWRLETAAAVTWSQNINLIVCSITTVQYVSNNKCSSWFSLKHKPILSILLIQFCAVGLKNLIKNQILN